MANDSSACPTSSNSGLCPSEVLLQGKSPQEAEKIKKLYYTALGINETLKQRRDHFVASRDSKDVFSTFYYHTTYNGLSLINQGQLTHPDVALEEILKFYDAYQHNYQGGNEGHWKNYYATAGKLTKDISGTGSLSTLLYRGLIAHIYYDLPRALHSVLSTQNPTDIPSIKDDFDQFDSLFGKTSSESFADLSLAVGDQNNPFDIPATTDILGYFGRDYMGSRVARADRHDAWDRAVANTLPKGLGPQPQINHDSLEEMGRHLCPDNPVPVLVIDRSGSLTEQPGAMQQIQRKAVEVVRAIQDSVGEAAIVNFSGAGNSSATDFTSDTNILLGAIQGGGVGNTGTAIYDAVVRAVTVASQNDKQAMLILFTDGINNQGTGIGTAIRYCQEKGIAVIIVGFAGTEGRNEAELNQLARSTGGFYVANESASVTRILERFKNYSAAKKRTKVTNTGTAD